MNLIEDHITIKKLLKWLITLCLVKAVAIIVLGILVANLYIDLGELWEIYGEINRFFLDVLQDARNMHRGMNI